MKKIFATSYYLLTTMLGAFQSLIVTFDAIRSWTDPATQGSPYRTNRLGRRGFI